MRDAVAFWNENGAPRLTARTADEAGGLLDGLQLLEPGVVPTPRWRPEGADLGLPAEVAHYGAVARKP